MLTFLFWNLNGKRLEESVSRLAGLHAVDVVMLAECAVPPATMLESLNAENSSVFELPFSLSRTILIFTRFNRKFLMPVEDDGGRMTIRRLAIPNRTDVLLVCAHLVSKLYWSDASQSQECVVISRRIRDIEERHGHTRTILVGDLNMNPFEVGLVSSFGLNATMSKTIARRGSRKIRGIDYPFFYNPMWSHFGDARNTPPGTYYHGTQPVTYYWNMFDQVLMRSSLIDTFRSDSLKILDSDGTNLLVNNSGRPAASVASDHLPILFGFDL